MSHDPYNTEIFTTSHTEGSQPSAWTNDALLFPIATNFLFELDDARKLGSSFVTKWITPLRNELIAKRSHTDTHILEIATLQFNLGTRLCAYGVAQSNQSFLEEAKEHFVSAAQSAATTDDPYIQAKSMHMLGYTLDILARIGSNIKLFRDAVLADVSAAALYYKIDDHEQCGNVWSNAGYTCMAIASRTTSIADYQSALEAFLSASTQYTKAGDAHCSAHAAYLQSTVKLEIAKLTGNRDDFVATADLSKRAALAGDLAGNHLAQAGALHCCGLALGAIGEHQSASSCFSEAAIVYQSTGDLPKAANSRFEQGRSLMFLSQSSRNELTAPLTAAEAFEFSAEQFKNTEQLRELAHALHFLGIAYMEAADRSRSAYFYDKAFDSLRNASQSYTTVGNYENSVVMNYLSGLALLRNAALTNDLKKYRLAAEISATTAEQAITPGGEEWRANALFNRGISLLKIATYTELTADYSLAANVLEEAAKALEQVGHLDRMEQSLHGYQAAIDCANGKKSRIDIDIGMMTVVVSSRDGGHARDRGAVSSEASIGDNETDLRAIFVAADAADLARALVPPVPEIAIRRPEELIREAQVSPPADKDSFVKSINSILDAHHLRIQANDENFPARLAFKDGTIRLAVAGGRGHRRFTDRQLHIVQIPHNYGARGSRNPDSNQP